MSSFQFKIHISVGLSYLLVGASGVLAHRLGWNSQHPSIGIGAVLLLGAVELKLLSSTRAKGFLLMMGLATALLLGLGARMGLTAVGLHAFVVWPLVIIGFIWHVQLGLAPPASSPGNPI